MAPVIVRRNDISGMVNRVVVPIKNRIEPLTVSEGIEKNIKILTPEVVF